MHILLLSLLGCGAQSEIPAEPEPVVLAETALGAINPGSPSALLGGTDVVYLRREVDITAQVVCYISTRGMDCMPCSETSGIVPGCREKHR